MARHFLSGEELSGAELEALLDRAAELKAGRASGEGSAALDGKTVALFFEKPSTRTRVSFQVGVAELGGHPLPLRGDELQLGRGESIGDTARVLSRYLHAIVIRSGSHETVAELAAGADVPVINALTPLHHPCQALADLLTLRERFGDLDGPAARLRRRRQQRRPLAGAPRPGRRGGGGRRRARRLSARGRRGDSPDERPSQRGRGRRRDLHGRLGQHGRRGRGRLSPRRAGAVPGRRGAPGGRGRGRDRPPLPARRTPARRSPPASSTAIAPPSGTRPRTASTPRRPSSSSWWGSPRRLTGNDGPRSSPSSVLSRPNGAAIQAPCVLAWRRLGLVIPW